MTTNELKSYVDRILGDSVRVLLPSYWWKRAFGAVIDKVDEKVEKDDLKTVNGQSILGEGDLKICVKKVNSISELNSIDASSGDIVSISGELVQKKQSELNYVGGENAEEVFAQNAIIKGVSISAPTSVDFDAWCGFVAADESYILIAYLTTDNQIIFIEDFASENPVLLYNGANVVNSGVSRLNGLLGKKDYVCIGAFQLVGNTNTEELSAQVDSWLDVLIEGSAEAYIKSKSWDKLAKEYIVPSEEELNRLDVPMGTMAKVASDYEVKKYRDTKISDSANNDYDRVLGIELLSVPSTSFEISFYVKELEDNNKSLRITCFGTGRIDGVIYRMEGNTSYRETVYPLALDYKINTGEVNEFNNLLRSMDCLVKHSTGTSESIYSVTDQTLSFHVAIDPISDAYIKSDTWKRLLKEGDVTGGGGLKYGEERIVYIPTLNNPISDEQKAYNAETFAKVRGGNSVSLSFVGCFFANLMHSDELAVFNTWFSPNLYGSITIYPTGEANYSLKSIADSELSATSKNPVQNKVVYAGLADLAVVVDDLGVAFNNRFETCEKTISQKADTTYVNEKIGDINSILDLINEEEI